ncbi:crotonyl-CoA carboxylase/reductase [Leptospira biflexa]|uniref:Putative alcohol dehydrogenase, zinc-containing alcohol dehydrogenase family n=1 Tax=Leptospira biflexa serovar Patoc (strain Patoc 1 / ATCC 23582 / Paris) TaxID=456481 RepID=B0SQ31_LEPBP|nr:crotonyl-CoA carboxylase/reductase [Leptospira biflexa]ABZ95478.1 Zinc-binding dehydrogenase [Leptospira biflexa serovar Patoc strain 'Patoc 1 (Ames)']ABZ99183.1 Putative alcohol dehydrogenase, zinc-containing alcohol dehydrogenase family [Leptospira biflexa serovar Patoc strain 'Patoc 1 (Paris)']TGM46704.1 crotonyl-CoA carboxylase/reductase [Leptospira biflexa]TGM50831.1 crotonyl-CoA carboxylase/reductase [Leptospira biflexa]TGM56103.1 crotonyl-CoA carboxylase/reductase [Leptospira biflexa
MSNVEIVPVGELPPIGVVPKKMHAQVIRPERYGEPKTSFQSEVIDVPEIGPNEVLVATMAAGVNYNNVWAALGYPVDVIAARNKKGEPEKFHIGGSDASGIVYKVGSEVKNVKVGDEVVVHCAMWDPKDPWVLSGKDPMYAPSQIIWGYESNWGSFAQFCKVQDHQCLPRPQHLTWEASAAYMLVAATAYRMLHHWKPNDVKPGDVVLIWGGAGGLGAMAIQIVKAAGGIPIAVVSSDDKIEFCKNLGATGVINRNKFKHWGALTSEINKPEAFVEWTKQAREFGKAIWDIAGKGKNPQIVFEHPGETTLPTSVFVCETGGMVVICAGTTGFNATGDLRYLWMRQKRLQGSHFANDDNCRDLNQLVIDKKVDPVLAQTFTFDQTGECHQLMRENKHPAGNMSILVGAKTTGLGKK